MVFHQDMLCKLTSSFSRPYAVSVFCFIMLTSWETKRHCISNSAPHHCFSILWGPSCIMLRLFRWVSYTMLATNMIFFLEVVSVVWLTFLVLQINFCALPSAAANRYESAPRMVPHREPIGMHSIASLHSQDHSCRNLIAMMVLERWRKRTVSWRTHSFMFILRE